MPDKDESPDQVLPLAEERLIVSKREAVTGRVTVRTVVDERQERVRETLAREEADVERVAIDRAIDAVPEPRWEGDVFVVPVVEEILVVEKRLRLKEEVRITRLRRSEDVDEPVTLRSTRAVVERSELGGDAT
jgi:stress response protein YsnF